MAKDTARIAADDRKRPEPFRRVRTSPAHRPHRAQKADDAFIVSKVPNHISLIEFIGPCVKRRGGPASASLWLLGYTATLKGIAPPLTRQNPSQLILENLKRASK
jgi:hypothetical protein